MAQVRNTSGDRTSRFATPHHGRVESHIHDYGHPNQQPSRHVQGNNNNRNQEARKCVRPSTPRRGYNRSRSTFSQLDEDVLLHIISHLDVKDILTLRQTSTTFSVLTRISPVWHNALTRHVLLRDMPVPIFRSPPSSVRNTIDSTKQSRLETLTLAALSLHRRWKAPHAPARRERKWETGVGTVDVVKFVHAVAVDTRGEAGSRKQKIRFGPGIREDPDNWRSHVGSGEQSSLPSRVCNDDQVWARYMLTMGIAMPGVASVQIWDLDTSHRKLNRAPLSARGVDSEDDDEGSIECVASSNFRGTVTGFAIDEGTGTAVNATFALSTIQSDRAQPTRSLLHVYSLCAPTSSPHPNLVASFSLSHPLPSRVLALKGRFVILERKRAFVHPGAEANVHPTASEVIVADWTSPQRCEVELVSRGPDHPSINSSILATHVVNEWVLIFRATRIELYPISAWIEAHSKYSEGVQNVNGTSHPNRTRDVSNRQRNSSVSVTPSAHPGLMPRNRSSTMSTSSEYSSDDVPRVVYPTAVYPFRETVFSIVVTERVSYSWERKKGSCRVCQLGMSMVGGPSSRHRSVGPTTTLRHSNTQSSYSNRLPLQQRPNMTVSLASGGGGLSSRPCACNFRPLSLVIRFLSSRSNGSHNPQDTVGASPKDVVEHYVLNVNENYFPGGKSTELPYVLPPVHTQTYRSGDSERRPLAMGKYGTLVGIENLSCIRQTHRPGYEPAVAPSGNGGWSLSGFLRRGVSGSSLVSTAGANSSSPPRGQASHVAIVGRVLCMSRPEPDDEAYRRKVSRRTGEEHHEVTNGSIPQSTRSSSSQMDLTNFRAPYSSPILADASIVSSLDLDEPTGRIAMGDRDGWVRVWEYL